MVTVEIRQGGEPLPSSIDNDSSPIYLLSGPTACGKTSAALDWAETNKAWILSCDALLFYKGANIGTAKPSPSEQKRVRHFGIDMVPPSETYNIQSFVNYSLKVIHEAQKKNVPLLVTGGSGFYLASFFRSVADDLAIPKEIGEAVAGIERTGGLPALLQKLAEINGSLPNCIDLQNPRRVSKALERSWTTGRKVEDLMETFRRAPSPFAEFHRHLVWLERPLRELEKRIRQRTKLMLQQGLIEEVSNLLDEGMEENPTLRAAIGYREVVQYLCGQLDRSDLEYEICLHTNRLARRQIKWFTKNFKKYMLQN